MCHSTKILTLHFSVDILVTSTVCIVMVSNCLHTNLYVQADQSLASSEGYVQADQSLASSEGYVQADQSLASSEGEKGISSFTYDC